VAVLLCGVPEDETMTADPLVWAATVLRTHRDGVLARWLEEAAAQPFHKGQQESAISDDMPRLLDALIAYLAHAPEAVDPQTPFDDAAVRDAAAAHARTRADQGLQPAQVVIEFRLMRQEIRRALQAQAPGELPPTALRDAELLVIDVLDGVIAVGLETFTTHVEMIRTEFLATTVHDVRHPLTALQGTAQLAVQRLRHGTFDPAQLERLLGTVLAEAARLGTLLQRLADTARVTLGALDLQVGPVDLAALAHTTLATLPPEAAERVVLHVPVGADVQVVGDSVRLREVLDNLLSNALKYAPAPTPVQVRLEPEDTGVHLQVQDDGMGIAPGDLPLLFQRYRRTAAAHAAGIPGAGLGLYLCRAIIAQHGGRIWAASAGVGQGTTLHIVLPRQPSPSPNGPPAAEGGALP